MYGPARCRLLPMRSIFTNFWDSLFLFWTHYFLFGPSIPFLDMTPILIRYLILLEPCAV